MPIPERYCSTRTRPQYFRTRTFYMNTPRVLDLRNPTSEVVLFGNNRQAPHYNVPIRPIPEQYCSMATRLQLSLTIAPQRHQLIRKFPIPTAWICCHQKASSSHRSATFLHRHHAHHWQQLCWLASTTSSKCWIIRTLYLRSQGHRLPLTAESTTSVINADEVHHARMMTLIRQRAIFAQHRLYLPEAELNIRTNEEVFDNNGEWLLVLTKYIPWLDTNTFFLQNYIDNEYVNGTWSLS